MASSLNGTGLTFSTGATLNSPPVTSITAGGGLTGGTITTTGTIAIDTTTYAIGQQITGRPANTTAYAVGSTVAGSSLYSVSPAVNYISSTWQIGQGGFTVIAGAATLINTGTWKCVSPAPSGAFGCTPGGASGTWVRIS